MITRNQNVHVLISDISHSWLLPGVSLHNAGFCNCTPSHKAQEKLLCITENYHEFTSDEYEGGKQASSTDSFLCLLVLHTGYCWEEN